MQGQNGQPNDYLEGAEFFMRDDLRWLAKTIQVNEREVRAYYQSTSFSPNFPIKFGKYNAILFF